LQPFIKGVEITYQELTSVLRRNGIEEIPTDILYDPDLHQVFECIENSGYEPGTILDVKRKGYKYRDRVLRTALVSIAGSVSECPEA
jgi:molecular chaperone GrpE